MKGKNKQTDCHCKSCKKRTCKIAIEKRTISLGKKIPFTNDTIAFKSKMKDNEYLTNNKKELF